MVKRCKCGDSLEAHTLLVQVSVIPNLLTQTYDDIKDWDRELIESCANELNLRKDRLNPCFFHFSCGCEDYEESFSSLVNGARQLREDELNGR